MALDVLKGESPEKVRAAYDQALSQVKDALGIDSGKKEEEGQITLGYDDSLKGELEDMTPEESAKITGFIEFKYRRGAGYEQTEIRVDKGASTMLSHFTLNSDGLGNIAYANPAIIVGNNEIKLKGLEAGDSFDYDLGFQDNQPVTRQLVGMEFARWVTKCVAEDKLSPGPEVRIIDAPIRDDKEEGAEDFEQEEN